MLQSPLHYSNVALVDPVTKGAVRVAKRFLEDGTKVQPVLIVPVSTSTDPMFCFITVTKTPLPVKMQRHEGNGPFVQLKFSRFKIAFTPLAKTGK